ncbi:MAG TPA: hypothetical protein VF111_10265 [Thermoanaerobaculia bacterium]
MKKLGVAAALSLCALSASASNFRGADQVYVPAAGHLAGGSGTFISDVFVSSLETTDEVDVSVIYSPTTGLSGGVIEKKNAFRLKAGERKTFVDFFPSVLGIQSGLGQLIFNGCLAGADCGPATQDADGYSPFFRSISVESRIYSIPPNTTLAQKPPTLGQGFSGIPWYMFASSLQAGNKLDKVFIAGVTQNGGINEPGTYRSNLGLVNASQYSTTTLVATLYQNDMTAANKKGEYTVTLGPLGHIQVNVPTAFPGFSGTNAFIVVEQRNSVPTSDAPSGCVQGCPAFLAYGSILDNVSGDPTTLEPQFFAPLSEDAIAVIFPSGSGKSGNRRSVRH